MHSTLSATVVPCSIQSLTDAMASSGVIAAMTPIPVIGVPIKSSLDGLDSLLAIVQMPPGIPVAAVGIDNGKNAALLAIAILCLNDNDLHDKLLAYRKSWNTQ